MRFFTSVGPNPRVVAIFMAEKGISLPEVVVDLRGGENRRAPYNVEVNPAGQTPALELDDGSILTEITAICEYLEERFPDPVLIGSTPEERAATRMWTRRVDLKICEPLTNGFRFSEGLPLFEGRMRCLPEAAAGLKAVAQDGLKWLDPLIAGREFIAGDRVSLADILLFAFLDFGAGVGQPIDPANGNVIRWFEAMKARPSVNPS
ncbi:glutathione S-transferase family protein [Sphingopyxis sp. 113P3]|jgi:Glutathione S-transferase|uniref:glutathione S-transferase family protein n=1 Tax=Sphingopyxis sp. (strain 113P3) TaxID=292913 RepID=UPI0006AD348F|nr:glutathione S-transferase [Sphingopyxis sp. 113P3]ALC11758.1 glutathione S-transferase [Sphingopyxis sp. 113P3]